jgi:hypothetical protein
VALLALGIKRQKWNRKGRQEQNEEEPTFHTGLPPLIHGLTLGAIAGAKVKLKEEESHPAFFLIIE